MHKKLRALREKIESLKLQGDYKEMINACYLLMQTAAEEGDRQLQMEAYAYFAFGFYKLGDMKEAFQNIEKHAALCEVHGTKQDYMYSYYILFLLYDYTGNYKKAKQVLTTSVEIAQQLKDMRAVSENYSDLCYTLCNLGEFDEALKAGEKAAMIAVKQEPYCPFLVIKALLASSYALLKLGDTEKATSLVETVLHDKLLKQYPVETIKSYRLEAEIYLVQGNLKAALSSLETAARSARTSLHFRQLKEVWSQQINLYDQLGEYQKGFHIQQQYILLVEDMHRQEISNSAMKLEMKVKLQELEKQANTDFLTGIASRRGIEDIAATWIGKSSKLKQNIVCIAFDVDNLKGINDKYGHPFGDKVIRKVAETSSKFLSEKGIVGRIGGDEFVAVLPNISLEEAFQVANELLSAMRKTHLYYNEKRVVISLSAGVADNNYGLVTEYPKLYHKADIALYKAKRGGKNQVISYESTTKKV